MSGFSHVHTSDGYVPILLTILFVLILVNAYIYKRKGGMPKIADVETELDGSKDRLSIMVDGMTCSHCKENVENAVYSCSGVENTLVDLLTGQVIVIGNELDEGAIKDKIKNIGFSFK